MSRASRNGRLRNRPRGSVTHSKPLILLPTKKNHSYVKSDRLNPTGVVVETPDWFRAGEPATFDVSIIIPMFRSAQEICNQIESWDGVALDGLSKEIIYVDDCCPDDSAAWVIRSWEKFRNRWNGMRSVCGNYNGYIGKIIKNGGNYGFSASCNMGASQARGKYLIFLHADTIVSSNWMYPIIDALKSNQDAGIVGNLQLMEDGSIDSAGREWFWDNLCFEDIGKDVFEGKRLETKMCLEQLLPGVEVRDSVSGCCLAISKELFDKVGGFDMNYRISYWEDADLCMKVKEQGYKIYFQPQSAIYHKGYHTEANLHPYMSDNANLFASKWIENGKMNDLVNKRLK